MDFSIITINYNNINGLIETAKSIISQTYHNFEWIIIDGGSSDGSKELLEQYKDYLAYWCSEPDDGVYNAMNKGIAVSKGSYLVFMNSGDTFCNKDVLKNTVPFLGSADILYGDWYQVYDTYSELKHLNIDNLYKTLRFQNICHQAMFTKATLLKQNGYDESMRLLADWKRCTEFALSGYAFAPLPFAVCNYNMDGLSSTSSSGLIDEEYQRVLSVYPAWLNKLFEELYKFENDYYIQLLSKLFVYNKFTRILTVLYLRIMNLFVKSK